MISLLLGLAVFLELAAGTGLAYIAGFGAVQHVLPHFWRDWEWLAGVLGSLAVSFVGYYLAYSGISRGRRSPSDGQADARDRGGRVRRIPLLRRLDAGRLCPAGAGASKRESSVRVYALAGLEHGVLAIGGTVAAIIVLATGRSAPPMDFTLPWAVIPVPGFLIAFWLAERYRDGLRDEPRLRGKTGIFLDSIHLVCRLFMSPRSHWPAVPGMALFWAADMLAA